MIMSAVIECPRDRVNSTLVAVSASSNRSKSDSDPADRLPTFGKCRYVRQYVAVKMRWSLKVDRRERLALRRTASNCRNSFIKVRVAKIGTRSGSRCGSGSGSGSGAGTDPRFSYCYEAKDAGYGPYYEGRDPEYDWYTDGDDDGVVCE